MSDGNDWQDGGNDWNQSSDQPSGSSGGGEQFGAQGGSQAPGGGQFSGQGGAGGQGGGQGGGGFQPPSGGPPTDLVTEGWGGGPEVSFDEVIERLKVIASRAKGSILMAWLAIAAVLLVFEMVGSSLAAINYFVDSVAASAALGTISMIFGVIASVAYYVGVAFQLALFKPLHRALFEGEHSVGGPKEVLKEASSVFLPVLITILALNASSLGLVCCIVPGLFLLFVFCQAPYLAATRDLGPIDALKRSFELNKTHWMVLLIAIGGMVAVGLVAGCFFGASGLVIGWMSSFLRPFNLVFLDVIFWIVIQAFTFGTFLVHTTIFSTIETKETGRVPA